MQLFMPAPTKFIDRPFRFLWVKGLRKLAFTKTAVGFTVGEAIVWFGFVVMWPTILGGIYFLSGMFESGKAMPVNKFIVTSLVVACAKALVIIPFWWLFFRRLTRWQGWKRWVLHLPVGAIYSAITVFLVYQVKTRLLHDPYPATAVIGDCYNMLTAYFMNFILFHAYNFWLSSQRQMKKEQELRELAFQSEINALKTQIEPHFLFNTLNSISATVPPSQEKTRVLIAQLADTFRYALRVAESQSVPLGEELEFLKTWLALEQQRFGKRLTLDYRIDPEALAVQIPPMLLQPLVENALNHGIAHRLEGGTVTIECHRETNAVFVSVSDTGVGYAGGLEEILHKGVGLSNTAKRLQLLYNAPLRVARQDKGLCFSFQLPLKPVHEPKRVDY